MLQKILIQTRSVHITFHSKNFITWLDVLDRELPAVKNSKTFWTLFSITLSSSVMVGIRAAGLKRPIVGTILKIGIAFWTPSKDIIFTSCSLVTASMPLTICFPPEIMSQMIITLHTSIYASQWGTSIHS